MQSVEEIMLTLVSTRIGEAGPLKERCASNRPSAAVVFGVTRHIPSVGARVGDGNTETGLGQVNPPMSMDFKPESIPRRIGVGGASDVAHLDLIIGMIRVDVHWPGQLQEAVLLVPVDMGVHLDTRISRIDSQRLDCAGVAKSPRDADGH